MPKGQLVEQYQAADGFEADIRRHEDVFGNQVYTAIGVGPRLSGMQLFGGQVFPTLTHVRQAVEGPGGGA